MKNRPRLSVVPANGLIDYYQRSRATIIEGNRETRLEAYRQVRDTLKKRIEVRFALDLKPVV